MMGSVSPLFCKAFWYSGMSDERRVADFRALFINALSFDIWVDFN